MCQGELCAQFLYMWYKKWRFSLRVTTETVLEIQFGVSLTIYNLYRRREERRDSRPCKTLSYPMLHWDTELCDLVNWLAISAPLLPLWKGSSLYGSTAVPHPSMHQIKGRKAAAEHYGKFSKPSTCIFLTQPRSGAHLLWRYKSFIYVFFTALKSYKWWYNMTHGLLYCTFNGFF